jgi:serine/threonine protein kinase
MQFLSTGELVGEKYTVEAFLGSGAMGSVYRVRHEDLGSTFALKLLSPVYSFDKNYRLRFKREAKINAQIKHQNVVQVYDTGDHDGLLYTVMELLDGRDLRYFLDRERVQDIEQVVDIGVQLASALSAAHDIGLVHRDLKPANILIEDRGDQWRCVVVDFGLAFIEKDEELGRLTKTDSTVAGTPLYMSPEQVSGKTLTSASDMYAFGCLLYELIEGNTPFEDTNDDVVKVMTRQLFSPPPKMSRAERRRVPVALESLVYKMLEKDPARRPSTRDVLRLLQDLQQLPSQWGRGGDWQARSGRMVAPVTERQVLESAVTSQFEVTTTSTFHDLQDIGLIGAPEHMDMIAALGSNGFQLVPFEPSIEVGVLFGRDLSVEEVERLSQDHVVIVATSLDDMDHVAALLRAGALDVIPSDFTPDDLTKRLKRAQRRARRNNAR